MTKEEIIGALTGGSPPSERIEAFAELNDGEEFFGDMLETEFAVFVDGWECAVSFLSVTGKLNYD